MWRAFFANCVSRSRPKLPKCVQFSLLNRAVRLVMDYRSTRWPPQQSLQKQIDRAQRMMVAILLRPPPLEDETIPDFVRRRHRIVAQHCRNEGLWSRRHCERVLNWRSHLERDANRWSWPALLLHHRGSQWLQQTRVEHCSLPTGGRTGTRSSPGFVARLWHDGVAYAESIT